MRRITPALSLFAAVLFACSMGSAEAQRPARPPESDNAVQQCVKRLATSLAAALRPQEFPISEVAEKVVRLKLAPEAAVYEGLELDILGKDAAAPPVGRVKVTSVANGVAECEVLKLAAEVKPAAGQMLRTAVTPLVVGVAGAYGPVGDRPCALSQYLAQELSDRLVGTSRISKVVSRDLLSVFVGPNVDSGGRIVEQGLTELKNPENLRTLGQNTKTDALLVAHLEPKPSGVQVTVRLYAVSDGATLATVRDTFDPQAVSWLLPGSLLYEDRLADDDPDRKELAGKWKARDFGGKALLTPDTTNFNFSLVNYDFGSDYTVQLIHGGEHQSPWQETLILQWKNASNWTGVRFTGPNAYIIGVAGGRAWNAPGATLDVSDPGGRGYLELEATVMGGNITVAAKGKKISHTIQPLPGFIGLACVGNTDTQATIPSVWRISRLRVVRAIR